MGTHLLSMTPATADRATRFVMTLPMRYRCPGSSEWTSGSTVNISRSGVLFESDIALPPGTGLEILVELSNDNTALAAVRCSATVIRQEEERRFAARFFDYHLVARKNLALD